MGRLLRYFLCQILNNAQAMAVSNKVVVILTVSPNDPTYLDSMLDKSQAPITDRHEQLHHQNVC
jgi:hypothetical protein